MLRNTCGIFHFHFIRSFLGFSSDTWRWCYMLRPQEPWKARNSCEGTYLFHYCCCPWHWCQSEVLSILAGHSVAKLSLSENFLLCKNQHTVPKTAGYFQTWLLQQQYQVLLPKKEQPFSPTVLSYCCYNRPQTIYSAAGSLSC